ncbi:GNAT family N-acetyltransferase [Hymenobacter sp. HSC-4F20]|uniref:GNAT family N-acetyltransferase n=1 Tax=Hymenobacter sp. HSC-4F20 TaxID=2864135 RepID=UPI001C737F33|nr:GNAT family N-acetyltransferase [Hymenobacter sp. HSC-4F20]MBX0292866.1 GNAT family N-acetyltransferase [Hymenobacter sp. HSC-4F20]
MPTRLLRHHEIDLTAWDACVDSARQVVPYACSWWLQATAGRWDALVELEEETGRYLTVWPLPVKWRPWGREVHQPPFTQQLGVLETTATTELLRLLQPVNQYSRFYTQLNTGNALPHCLALGAEVEQRRTYQLPLHKPYSQVQAAYTADYRRRLRLNESAATPLGVVEAVSAEPLLTLFQQTKGPQAGLKQQHYARLRRLVAALQQRQLLELREVRHPETNTLLAGALFVHYRTQLIYLFAAASETGKKAGAPLLLLDDAIRRHAGTPELILDFEGGMIPSIARFFANFGAEPVAYAALSFTQRPWYLKWMR